MSKHHSVRGEDRPHAKSSQRRRGSPLRDPLSQAFLHIATPILLLLLTILHVIYYLCLRTFSWLRSRNNTKHQENTFPLGHERQAEKRLVAFGNLVRNRDSQQDVHHLKAGPVSPQHIAIALGLKPVHTRTLLGRVFHKLIFGAVLNGGRRPRSPLHQAEDKEQVDYALDNAKAVLRYCAFAGVSELTLYDEFGYLRQALSVHKSAALDQVCSVEGYDTGFVLENATSTQTDMAPAHNDVPQGKPHVDGLGDIQTRSASGHRPSSPTVGVCRRSSGDESGGLNTQNQRLQIQAVLRFPFEKTSIPNKSTTNKSTSNQNTANQSTANRLPQQVRIRVNVLGPQDAKEALARAANLIADCSRWSRPVGVEAIADVLTGE